MEHKHGTYAAIYMDQESSDRLQEWCQQHDIPCQDDLHVSLIYSSHPVPELEEFNNLAVELTASVKGWKMLGEKCLTLELESKELHRINKLMMDAGATSDYPSYIPHTTVDDEYDGDIPDELPDFDLVYNQVSVEPLDPPEDTMAESIERFFARIK